MLEKIQILVLGSTKRQLALFEGEELLSINQSSSSAKDLESLEINKKIPTLIVSVRGDLTEQISQMTDTTLFSIEAASKLFRISGFYESLGQDRVSNLLGGISLSPGKSVLVVDFGTYTTSSILTAQDNSYEFEGGFIFAGISGILRSFNAYNDSLPSVNDLSFIEYSTLFSSGEKTLSTSQAIYQGLLTSSIGLVERARKQYPQHMIFITGGWSEVIYAHLRHLQGVRLEKNLLLSGAKAYWDRFRSSNE